MTVRIAGDAAEAEDDTRSLYEWLLLDRTLRREARVSMESSSEPVAGQQGTVLDVVSLVLGSGISGASLAVSIAQWRATRPQEPTLTVERADGSKVTITGASQARAQSLMADLLGEEQP